MYVIECNDVEEIKRLLNLVYGKDVSLIIKTNNAHFVAVIKRHYKNIKVKKIIES